MDVFCTNPIAKYNSSHVRNSSMDDSLHCSSLPRRCCSCQAFFFSSQAFFDCGGLTLLFVLENFLYCFSERCAFLQTSDTITLGSSNSVLPVQIPLISFRLSLSFPFKFCNLILTQKEPLFYLFCFYANVI